jgi:hypothetical protein
MVSLIAALRAPRLGVSAIGAATGLLVVAAGACGSPQDNTFYEHPPATMSPGSGGVGGAGGGAGGKASAGSGTGNASATGGSSASSSGGGGAGGVGASGGIPSGGAGAGGSAGSDASGTGGGAGDSTSGDAGMGGAAGEGGAGPSVDCTSHGENAVDFDAHCYVYEGEAVTWRDAVDACQGREGHLVTISSEGRTTAQFLAENAFVWELSGATQVWIAATDGKGPHQPGDGTFSKWITDEPMTLDNWTPGQPNNAESSCQNGDPCSCDEGKCYEHCGFLWEKAGKVMDSVPGWNDRLCDHRIGYVCEWDEG